MMQLRRHVSFLSAAVLCAILVGAQTSPAVCQAGQETGFHWNDDRQAGTADLMFGDQPVLRYMYAFDFSSEDRAHETYKVYHHVFGPGTNRLITKGPHGKFPHHRGMFVGWNKTSFDQDGRKTTLDFWHCKDGVHLRHIKFLEMQGDAESGTMTAEIHWNDANGEPVIVEQRTVTVSKPRSSNGLEAAWQIDWHTTLSSRRGEIRFNGDRQHAGFQFRAAQAVADANSARYVRPEGFPQQKEAFQVGDQGNPPPHINLGWFAMTYPLGGQKYTVEYFEDPALPKPSLYSERPYGRFGAFFKTTLTPEKPLTMRYRLVVSTGEPPTQQAIQGRYDVFLNALKTR